MSLVNLHELRPMLIAILISLCCQAVEHAHATAAAADAHEHTVVGMRATLTAELSAQLLAQAEARWQGRVQREYVPLTTHTELQSALREYQATAASLAAAAAAQVDDARQQVAAAQHEATTATAHARTLEARASVYESCIAELGAAREVLPSNASTASGFASVCTSPFACILLLIRPSLIAVVLIAHTLELALAVPFFGGLSILLLSCCLFEMFTTGRSSRRRVGPRGGGRTRRRHQRSAHARRTRARVARARRRVRRARRAAHRGANPESNCSCSR